MTAMADAQRLPISSSELRLASLLASMTDLVFVLDSERVFTEYHQHPDRTLFVPAEDFIGRSIYQIGFPQPALMKLEAAIAAVEINGTPQSVEYTLPLPDGPMQFEARVSRIADGAGGHAGVTVVARDVTRRHQAEVRRRALEQQLHEARRAEAVGVLAGGVAHEFNNLLTAVLGNLEYSIERAAAGPQLADTTVIDALRDALGAAERAAAISRTMLMLSGRAERRMESVDLSLILSRTLQRLKPALPVQLQLQLQLSADLPYIRGDADQLIWLTEALMRNAVEAAAEREPFIAVRSGADYFDASFLAAAIPAGQLRAGRLVWFEVADHGPGISEEARTRMFDPFFSTRSTRRGLELAVALAIVRAHGGAFLVDSVPDHGTRVRVLIPPDPVAGDSPPDEPAGPASR
jgi:two-component system, cell cycle sensor histidine kinase and response regulator CckA